MHTPEIPPPPKVPADLRLSGHGVRIQLPGILVMAIVSALTTGGVTFAIRKPDVPPDVRALTTAVEGLTTDVRDLKAQQRALVDAWNKAETQASVERGAAERARLELAELKGRLGMTINK